MRISDWSSDVCSSDLSFFTFAHRNVVQAVAAGLADGGAVDGYVWDTIIAQFPAWASGAHKVWQSPEYGFPPLVVRKDMATPTFEALNAALLQMHERTDGQLILERLADRKSTRLNTSH